MNRNNGTENTVPAEDMSIKEMPANDISEEELETARIQNRLKNLLWTISGDYSLGTEVNAAVFKKSKYIALYDAVCKGGFARYFRPRSSILKRPSSTAPSHRCFCRCPASVLKVRSGKNWRPIAAA